MKAGVIADISCCERGACWLSKTWSPGHAFLWSIMRGDRVSCRVLTATHSVQLLGGQGNNVWRAT